MSVENAKALIAKAKEDKALSEKLKAAGIDGFEKAAAEAGHPCTVDQVTEVLHAEGELDETDLDQAAGGVDCVNCITTCSAAENNFFVDGDNIINAGGDSNIVPDTTWIPEIS